MESMTPLIERFEEALVFAAGLHAGDIRKGTTIPYLAHLLGTASIALEHGATEDETSEPRARTEAYVRHIQDASPSVRLVSASDKLQNARACLADYRAIGDALWSRFKRRQGGHAPGRGNERFVDAFKAKDVARIMSVYVPSETLVVFDVVPPRQYVGWNAYKKDWEDFPALFDGPINVELTDLHVTTVGSLGYGHSIQRVSGAMRDGKTLDLTVRVTDVYRKIGGKWLIVHEHVSVPVDLTTGKPDLTSKP